MKSSLSEIQNFKREDAAASATVVGLTEFRQANGGRVRLGQDVHRRASVDISLVCEQSASGNVCESVSQSRTENYYYHLKRSHE